jgi:hypothetical protein
MENGEVARAPTDGANRNLSVKSLSFDVDSIMLHSIFSKYGAMAKCELLDAGEWSSGFA